MIKIVFFVILYLFLCFFCFAQENQDIYEPNTIIIKIKQTKKEICKNNRINDKNINEYFQKINVTSINKKFPNAISPKFKYNKFGEPLIDISRIYEIKYNSEFTIDQILTQLRKNKIIEYCQPSYIPKLLYTPSDPVISNQYYLANIKAYQAWDICKGDTNVVIGITDTGTDIAHSDLTGNIKYNYAEKPPYNGIDDDNDGFIDNYRGWDLGDNDNNPQAEGSPHGIWVSGLSSATTDNSIGIAGVGYNCKTLPVKIMSNDTLLNRTYEGIIYAADHGCSIINCSWGGHSGHPYGQDIINYATFNKNALVIAAAGNENNSAIYYPASYENVISVAATNINDLKWTPQNTGTTSGSSYGIYVDVSAPGTFTYTTNTNNNYYTPWGGTSFAAPIVAGCAGIIKARFPNLSALQIGELLRVSADLIDTISGNAPYISLLGSGRVNLYNALIDTLKPSIRFKNIKFSENNNSIDPSDTVEIHGTFKNYLAQGNNITATITSTSSYITIFQSTIDIGTINTLDVFSNITNPFKVKISPTTPSYEVITFKITYSGDNYSAFEYFQLPVAPPIINININNIAVSLTSDGKIGYNNNTQQYGIGFMYKNSQSLLYEGGFLLGNSETKVPNCLRESNDFSFSNKIHRITPSVSSDFDANCDFSDINATSRKLNIAVKQNVFAWNIFNNQDYVILKYTLINKNTDTIKNLFAGLFIDWDIMDFNKNRVQYDSILMLLHAYSTEATGLFTGIKMLSRLNADPYAFDLTNSGNGGIDIVDNFTTQEKYLALTGKRNNAGISDEGNDIATMLSAGSFNIPPNDSIDIAFALIGSETIIGIENAANSAQSKYDSLFGGVNINEINSDNIDILIYPNPTANNLNINIKNCLNNDFSINLFNISGQTVNIPIKKHKENLFSTDISMLKEGIYFIQLTSKAKTIIKKIVIIH